MGGADPRTQLSSLQCVFPNQAPQEQGSFLLLASSQSTPVSGSVVLDPGVEAGRARLPLAHGSLWLVCRKHQQYDCKWYIPLADLVFPSPEESEASPQVHPFPDHELEDMKMKISALKSEIQKEVSRAWYLSLGPFEPAVLGEVEAGSCKV